MIILDFIATIVEDFCITYFLLSYFNVKSKAKIIFLTVLSVIETYVCNNIIVDNELLLLSLLLTFVAYFLIEFKKITFLYLFLPIVLMGLLLLSNAISLSLVSFIFDIAMSEVSLSSHYMITGIILSRILFILFIILFYTIIKKDTNSFNVKHWWLLGVFVLMFFMMLATILEALIFNIISINLIYTILIELLLLISISFYLYYIIQKQNNENIKMTKQINENEYQTRMYNLMKKIHNQVTVDKHMMIYNLMNIYMLLSANNNNEAKQFVKKEINKLLKYKYISSTHNGLFDYEVTRKINILKEQGVDVKTLFNINGHNEVLNQNSVIDFLINCIDKVCEDINIINKIEFFVKEKDNYIIFKMIVLSSNIEKLEQKCIFKDMDYVTYSMQKRQNYLTISFLLE